MKVKWVKKKVDGDEFYIRKYKYHWWQIYKTWHMRDGRVARYDCISGVMYQRLECNYYRS